MCLGYPSAGRRSRVRMLLVRDFNYAVQMDVNHLRDRKILYIADLKTKFDIALQVNGESTIDLLQTLRRGRLTRTGPIQEFELYHMTSHEMIGKLEVSLDSSAESFSRCESVDRTSGESWELSWRHGSSHDERMS